MVAVTVCLGNVSVIPVGRVVDVTYPLRCRVRMAVVDMASVDMDVVSVILDINHHSAHV